MYRKNLRLGFFGHSIAVRNTAPDQQVESFIDMIVKKTDAKVVHEGAILCSTERILYELKKMKNTMDAAVIFHTDPDYYFAPFSPKRDFQCIKKADLEFKIKEGKLRGISVEDATFKEIGEQANPFFFSGTHVNIPEAVSALSAFNEFFYDRDLQLNRHYGALMQIDQYLLHKHIPVVHCLHPRKNFIPDWFEFKSGVVETEFQKFQNNQYREDDFRISANNINSVGNAIIFKKLLPLIEQAFLKIGR